MLAKFGVVFFPPSLLLEGLEEELSEGPLEPSAQGLGDGAEEGAASGGEAGGGLLHFRGQQCCMFLTVIRLPQFICVGSISSLCPGTWRCFLRCISCWSDTVAHLKSFHKEIIIVSVPK